MSTQMTNVSRLPVIHQHRRSAPEATTVAYIAMGVKEAIQRSSTPKRPDLEQWSGELGFVGHIVEPWALELDRMADAEEAAGKEFSGCFAYEVAEEFGLRYALALLGNTGEEPQAIARDLMAALTT